MRISDWSSDVCSSDLDGADARPAVAAHARAREDLLAGAIAAFGPADPVRRIGRRHDTGRIVAGDRRHAAQIDDQRANVVRGQVPQAQIDRSEEHTSELQSLMRNSYAVFCLKKKKTPYQNKHVKFTNTTQKETRKE